MRGQGEEDACMCWRFGDEAVCFLFCNKTCCLHLCKQGAEKVNISYGEIQERERGVSRFWLRSNKKSDGISASAQLCLHFPIQIMKKKSKCPTKRRKTFWGLYQPGQPHDLWELNFDFYVVGSVPRTLNNAVLSRMLHRVPARWGPESTQLEGKLCRSPMQINKNIYKNIQCHSDIYRGFVIRYIKIISNSQWSPKLCYLCVITESLNIISV